MKTPAQLISRSKLGGCTLGIALATAVTSPASAQRVERQLQRPAAHSLLGAHGSPTTSFAERSVTMSAAGEAEFDFFVDSQPNSDFLRVYVDGVQRFQMSGRHRAGRGTVPIAAGTHVLRFSYEKDAGSDAGRDVAFIDNLLIDGADPDSFRFDEPTFGTPQGWTAGGFGGGWTVAPHAPRRGIRRAIEGAQTGYNPAGVRSAVERQITWPGGSNDNELVVSYFVDSERDRDFFRIFIDGVEKFSASGSQQSGRAKVDVGGAGAHTVRFEYAKDESVDEGLDDAMVLGYEARANDDTFEISNFDGATVGSTSADWIKSASADFGWVIAPGVRPEVFAPPITVASPPAIDGVREDAYDPSTRLLVRDSGVIDGARSKGELLFQANPSTMLFIQRVQGRTAALGGEQGDITVYLDLQHLRTMRGGGCMGNSTLPGSEDRRIRITYVSSAGAAAATVNVAQDTGTCSASAWQPATAGESLPVSAAVIEESSDLGFARLELRVDLSGTDVATEGMLGLGLSVDSAPSVSYRLPGHDGFPLLSDDVSSWENVFLAQKTPGARTPRHVVLDGVQPSP